MLTSSLVTLFIGGCDPVVSSTDPVDVERAAGKRSDRFPNIRLVTHDERAVSFYDDLVRDRTVIINFMYATCDGACPGTTRNMVKIHRLLGDRVGDDILMLSITIDGDKLDSPEALRGFADRYGGTKPGWLYLTGNYEEIDELRHALGAYDLDPVIDADKTQHSGLLTFGNDRTDRWSALPALMDSGQIVEAILRVSEGDSTTDAADASTRGSRHDG